MATGMGNEVAGSTRAGVEIALRWLAVRKEGTPLRFLRYAIEDPTSESAHVLGCLVEPTASLPAASPELRAVGVWGLIVDEIERLGSADTSRRRNVLIAAFRLSPVPGGGTTWKATLEDRFRQLIGLSGVFGDPPPTTTTPMHKAWRRAIGKLAVCVQQKLELLRHDGQKWQNYVEIGRRETTRLSRVRAAGSQSDFGSGYRVPSPGAQPLFVERMLVRVVMHRRAVLRRTTERDVIACEDGVDVFDASSSIGWAASPFKLPVKPIWACRLVTRRGAQLDDVAAASLRFRKVLRRGDRYQFVSETWNDDLENHHCWINVDVDHHGIAPGAADEGGRPVAGLTMQVTFDQFCLPAACWWYADHTERERLTRPATGDPHLIPIGDGFVEHTFTDACQPRGNYGFAFEWPPE